VGGQGVLSTLWHPLAPDETAALQRSAQIVKDAITGIQGEIHA
jgi:hypothetical protein